MYNGTAEYMIDTDIFDRKLANIPEIDYLMDYIQRYDMFGVTIEFTIYDRAVGVNQERIIINEIRNF